MRRLTDVERSLPVAERPRRPEWMKVRAPSAASKYFDVKKLIHGASLHTICEEARCPNIAECWGRGTATFQILGDTCTRACRYCYVHSGKPESPPDPLEPLRLANTAAQMSLTHVVVTSVDRDDLPDRGAGHYAATIRALKRKVPQASVEVLTPDFLVLSGEALLIVEDEERPLRQWDFVHCPPEVSHTIVGAGSGRAVILAVGARANQHGEGWGGYPFSEVAMRHDASAERETNKAEEAYARFPRREATRYREGWLPSA